MLEFLNYVIRKTLNFLSWKLVLENVMIATNICLFTNIFFFTRMS